MSYALAVTSGKRGRTTGAQQIWKRFETRIAQELRLAWLATFKQAIMKGIVGRRSAALFADVPEEVASLSRQAHPSEPLELTRLPVDLTPAGDARS